MKICKCRKCGTAFEMPDDYRGSILCEECDPAMNPRTDPRDQRIKELEAEVVALKQTVQRQRDEREIIAHHARDYPTELDQARSTIAALLERMEREIENAADYWGDLTSDKYKPWVASRMAKIRKEMDIEKLGETEVKKVNQR